MGRHEEDFHEELTPGSLYMLLALPLATMAIAQDADDDQDAPYAGDVGVGPAVVPAPEVYGPPVCEWGYYSYYPYACAPYGYYGPSWFYDGVFIGVGPWYGWGGGYGYYGRRGFYGGHGWGRGGYGRARLGTWRLRWTWSLWRTRS